jgi:hypothetical protein
MKMPPEFQGFEDGLSSVFGDVGQGRPFILQVRAADGGESSTHTVAGWYSKRAARALTRVLIHLPLAVAQGNG